LRTIASIFSAIFRSSSGSLAIASARALSRSSCFCDAFRSAAAALIAARSSALNPLFVLFLG
jgi:hypothetical protein